MSWQKDKTKETKSERRINEMEESESGMGEMDRLPTEEEIMKQNYGREMEYFSGTGGRRRQKRQGGEAVAALRLGSSQSKPRVFTA